MATHSEAETLKELDTSLRNTINNYLHGNDVMYASVIGLLEIIKAEYVEMLAERDE